MDKLFFKNVLPNAKSSIVYKNATKGLSSFRITKKLLEGIWQKSKKLKHIAVLILRIPANEKENYVLTCQIKKEMR